MLQSVHLFASISFSVRHGEEWTLEEVAGKLESCEKLEKWEVIMVAVSSSVSSL